MHSNNLLNGGTSPQKRSPGVLSVTCPTLWQGGGRTLSLHRVDLGRQLPVVGRGRLLALHPAVSVIGWGTDIGRLLNLPESQFPNL